MWHAWERKVYRVFVVKSEGKRPLGRPRRLRIGTSEELL
jgi:hypothetical protein